MFVSRDVRFCETIFPFAAENGNSEKHDDCGPLFLEDVSAGPRRGNVCLQPDTKQTGRFDELTPQPRRQQPNDEKGDRLSSTDGPIAKKGQKPSGIVHEYFFNLGRVEKRAGQDLEERRNNSASSDLGRTEGDVGQRLYEGSSISTPDIFTKALGRDRFRFILSKLGICDPHAPT
ncbi:hypothetical protein CRG98_036314 [Punica granatum]|uniref:Uncharacterized protein n=1 Tax=Punica granatum TaxID=22663 RepID=A0A2I0IH66_PUNGR|nr:hypothetical protein CRG98_036314 [Punica granatum]